MGVSDSSSLKNLPSLELLIDKKDQKSSLYLENHNLKKIYAVPYRKCQSHI